MVVRTGLLAAMLGAGAAHASEAEPSSRVIGWSADGQRALVRVQKGSDDDIRDLSLHLLEAGQPDREFTILEPDDNQDPAVRGARWKAAEAEVTALGVVIDPDLQPVGADCGAVCGLVPGGSAASECQVGVGCTRDLWSGREGFLEYALEDGRSAVLSVVTLGTRFQSDDGIDRPQGKEGRKQGSAWTSDWVLMATLGAQHAVVKTLLVDVYGCTSCYSAPLEDGRVFVGPAGSLVWMWHHGSDAELSLVTRSEVTAAVR